ncbi:sunset domain-containing protein [Saccharomonospora azurea]
MSVFGQVWVFSAVAFVLGAFLAWLFLVRPAQKRIGELQRRLALTEGASRPGTAQRTRVAPPVRATDGADDKGREPATPPTRHFEPAPDPSEPTREATEHLAAGPSWPERDSLQGRTPKSEIDDLDEDFARFDELDDSLDDGVEGSAGGLLNDPTTRAVDEPTRIQGARGGALDVEPPPGTPDDADSGRGGRGGGSLFEPAPLDEPEDTPPAYAFGDRLAGDDTPVEHEEPVERTTMLPKRQPGRTQMESFEPVKSSQPSMRSVDRRDPGPQPGRGGSLFEPTVAPSTAAPSVRDTSAPGLPPGPFGPGSAMPKPGGGRPSGDFPVKASVTTLRYCTEDSPDYPRMVAEVWFRSPADAERVGFRPLPPSES